jgi:hypothetical protein
VAKKHYDVGKYLAASGTYVVDRAIRNLILPIEIVGRSDVIENTAVTFHRLPHLEHLHTAPDYAHPATSHQHLFALRSELWKCTE